MTILLLFTFLLFTLLGFAALRHALNHAVDGYEDDSGFFEETESVSEGGFRALRNQSLGDDGLPQESIVVHHSTFPPFPSKL
jgi:hypothetical protein